MRLIEFEAKNLLQEAGLAIPAGQLVTTPAEVEAAMREIPGAALKARVPAGRRLKAGGVRFPGIPAEAVQAARELLQTDIRGFRPACLLVEEKLSIERELFLSFIYDTFGKRPLDFGFGGGGGLRWMMMLATARRRCLPGVVLLPVSF